MMSFEFELLRFEDDDGRVPFSEWLAELEPTTRSRIWGSVSRMRFGNFGDSKSVGGGVLELRLHFGPGYRVYYVRDGRFVVVLLGGGDKDSQWKDIPRARHRAEEYRERK